MGTTLFVVGTVCGRMSQCVGGCRNMCGRMSQCIGGCCNVWEDVTICVESVVSVLLGFPAGDVLSPLTFR